MRAIEFTVTKRHIENGRKAVKAGWLPSLYCAVSQCLGEAFPGRNVSCAYTGWGPNGPNEGVIVIDDGSWPITPDVLRFSKRFDNGLPVHPITFALGWPDEVAQ